MQLIISHLAHYCVISMKQCCDKLMYLLVLNLLCQALYIYKPVLSTLLTGRLPMLRSLTIHSLFVGCISE